NPPTGDAYNGVANPSNVVKVPLFQQDNRGYSTSIDILNTAATPSNVTVTFNENGTDLAPRTFALPANGRFTVDKSNDGITTRFVGSATIVAQQPIAVEVDQSNGAILLADSGRGTGSPTLYAPLIMTNNNGWTTGLQVQNGGSESTTVSLFLNGGATPVATSPLAPGQSVSWYPVPGTTVISRFVGSAKVSSSNAQPLFGIVNELNGGAGQGMAYTPFGDGSRIVDMPLLMDDNSGYYTGEQIQNVGPVPATVDFTVNGALVDTRVILPGQSATWYKTKLLSGGVRVAAGSAIAREDTARIVGIVNEVTAPQRTGDTSFVYEAFNR
ncbi:MAG TPA: hypothetical protein VMW65_00795, partial [Chloroflexota bacterium]|nr:hypothetical protein [Chloroflexota bacterium]